MPPDYGEPPYVVGVHYKCAEVTPDSFSDAAFHLSHSRHGAVLCLSCRRGYDPDVSSSVQDFSEDNTVVAGSDGLLHLVCQTCQRAHAGFAVGSEVQWAQHQGDLSDQVQILEETATDLQ